MSIALIIRRYTNVLFRVSAHRDYDFVRYRSTPTYLLTYLLTYKLPISSSANGERG